MEQQVNTMKEVSVISVGFCVQAKYVFECVSKTTSFPVKQLAWYHNMDCCLPPKELFLSPQTIYLLRLSWMNEALCTITLLHFFFLKAKTNWSVCAMQCLFFAALHKLLWEVCSTVRVKVCSNKISQTLLKDLFARPWAVLVLEN